jgi:hypothetical protein
VFEKARPSQRTEMAISAHFPLPVQTLAPFGSIGGADFSNSYTPTRLAVTVRRISQARYGPAWSAHFAFSFCGFFFMFPFHFYFILGFFFYNFFSLFEFFSDSKKSDFKNRI